MEKFYPLFVTGLACSGSTLLARMLSAHRDLSVASDPYFPLFRWLRNAIVLQAQQIEVLRNFHPAMPLQDYYFRDEGLGILDLIQEADLNLAYDGKDWEKLYQASMDRARHECPDLLPHLAGLAGPTYKAMFDNALTIIGQSRGPGCRWVGMKEVWTVEFFRPLARAYPKARFIILLRDPRAMLASMLAMSQRDTSQLAHSLSYARHWRKCLAFVIKYQNAPLFSRRLYVLTFEQLVHAPEAKAREICNFLEVEFDPDMLDPGKYVDYATGGMWQPNTAFDRQVKGIDPQEAARWREKLEPKPLKMVDFVCSPDMQLAGYQSLTPSGENQPDPAVLEYILGNHVGAFSWRSDLEDPQQDYGFELFRRALLALPATFGDERLIRRSFLFPEVYTALRQEPPTLVV